MPEPKTELNFSSPYTLVVAVALSAQATDVSVNKATDRLFAVADTPAKMLELGEEGLVPFIASIGLYRGKAKNVIALSRILLEQHGGEVPLNRADLQALDTGCVWGGCLTAARVTGVPGQVERLAVRCEQARKPGKK